MEGYCSTGQNPQWAVVPMEEEEEEIEEEEEEGKRESWWQIGKNWRDIIRQAKAHIGL